MSGETIQLAKNPHKTKPIEYPKIGSEKIDGCAAEYWWDGDVIKCLSRSHKSTYPSTAHIKEYLEARLPKGYKVVGELHIPGMPFKDSGGFIRAGIVDERIKFGIYDMVKLGGDDRAFTDRYINALTYFPWIHLGPVFTIEHRRVNSSRELAIWAQCLKDENPVYEGMVLREMDEVWSPGKRVMIRIVDHPTVDVKLMRIDEAISKDGVPLGMAGGLQCLHEGSMIGVGPGKLKHDERRDMFLNPRKYLGRMLQAQYKKDDSYTALREPTWQLWREDKEE